MAANVLVDLDPVFAEYKSSEYLLEMVDLNIKELVTMFISNWLYYQRDCGMNGFSDRTEGRPLDQTLLALDLVIDQEGNPYVKDPETVSAIMRVMNGIWLDVQQCAITVVDRIQMSDYQRQHGRLGRWFGHNLIISFPDAKEQFR